MVEEELRGLKKSHNLGMLLFGLAGAAYCLWSLHLNRTAYRPTHEPVIGKLIPKGPVQIHEGPMGPWKLVTGEVPLLRRNSVYVPHSSEAEVQLNGKKKSHKVPPEVLVSFDEVLVETWDRVPYWSTETALPPPVSATTSTAGNIESYEAEFNQLNKKWKAYLRPKTESPLQTKAIFPVLDLVTDFEIDLVRPDQEAFSIRYFPWTEFVWSPVPVNGVAYHLEVSRNRNFSKLVTSSKTKSHKKRLQLSEPGKYFWRVRAEGKGGRIFSNVRFFEIVLRDEVNARSERQVSQTGTYWFEIATDSGFETIAQSASSTKPSCPKDGLFRGEYFCRIKRGKAGSVVKTYKFEVAE